MQFFCVTRILKPSVLLVKLRGVLDAGTSIELEMSLANYLTDASIKRIILEVSDLTFISSSGLRVMMLMIKALAPRQGRLYMVGASAQVVGLVKMSGMTKWILLRDNLLDCEEE